MAFAPGDLVHVTAIGKGIVREVRNGATYLVDVNGRSIVTTNDQLTPRETPRPAQAKAARVGRTPDVYAPANLRSEVLAASLDLHGNTVDEALEAVSGFLNRALLAGSLEVRIIHGRSGGKLKAALHAQLQRTPSIRGFALDPRNPGVTIVKL